MDHGTNSPILKAYLERTGASAEAHARAAIVMPAGNTRQAAFWRPYPLTIERGDGPLLWDVDGNRYVDLVSNYTAMVHGHNYPPIVEAVAKQYAAGTGWTAGTAAATSLAGQLVARVPSVDWVRFTNSGTEAGNLALTIARVVTGRDKILMARGGYHGSLMEFELGFLGQEGALNYVADFNDAVSFRAALESHGQDIAAVFLEPVLGASGIVPATAEFLGAVIEATREAGALFVLDEVQTFRLGPGGYQAEHGITPDLTMFAKLIGGGYPVGAVGGRDEYRELFDPDDLKIFHSGTYNGNPVTMAAGNAAVRELTAARIEHMHTLAETLKRGLLDVAGAAGLPLTISHVGSLMNLYFAPEDDAILEKFHLAALNHGLFVAPRGLIVLSTVMTGDLIGEVIGQAGAAMADVANEIN